MNSYGTHDAFTDFKNAFDLNDLSTTNPFYLKGNFNQSDMRGQSYFLLEGNSYLPCTKFSKMFEKATSLNTNVTIEAHSGSYYMALPLHKKPDFLSVSEYLEEQGLLSRLTDIEEIGCELRDAYLKQYQIETGALKRKKLLRKSDKKIHDEVSNKLMPLFTDYQNNQGVFSTLIHSNPFNFNLKPGNIEITMMYAFYTDLVSDKFDIGNLQTNVTANIQSNSTEEIPQTPLISGIDRSLKIISASFGEPDAIFKDIIIKAKSVGQKTTHHPLKLDVSSTFVDETPNEILSVDGALHTTVSPHTEYQLLVREGAKIDEKTLNDAINLFRF